MSNRHTTALVYTAGLCHGILKRAQQISPEQVSQYAQNSSPTWMADMQRQMQYRGYPMSGGGYAPYAYQGGQPQPFDYSPYLMGPQRQAMPESSTPVVPQPMNNGGGGYPDWMRYMNAGVAAGGVAAGGRPAAAAQAMQLGNGQPSNAVQTASSYAGLGQLGAQWLGWLARGKQWGQNLTRWAGKATYGVAGLNSVGNMVNEYNRPGSTSKDIALSGARGASNWITNPTAGMPVSFTAAQSAKNLANTAGRAAGRLGGLASVAQGALVVADREHSDRDTLENSNMSGGVLGTVNNAWSGWTNPYAHISGLLTAQNQMMNAHGQEVQGGYLADKAQRKAMPAYQRRWGQELAAGNELAGGQANDRNKFLRQHGSTEQRLMAGASGMQDPNERLRAFRRLAGQRPDMKQQIAKQYSGPTGVTTESEAGQSQVPGSPVQSVVKRSDAVLDKAFGLAFAIKVAALAGAELNQKAQQTAVQSTKGQQMAAPKPPAPSTPAVQTANQNARQTARTVGNVMQGPSIPAPAPTSGLTPSTPVQGQNNLQTVRNDPAPSQTGNTSVGMVNAGAVS